MLINHRLRNGRRKVQRQRYDADARVCLHDEASFDVFYLWCGWYMNMYIFSKMSQKRRGLLRLAGK